jgi:histidinol dehydrogenase
MPCEKSWSGVIKAVRERGDAAVLEFTEKFDGAKLSADRKCASHRPRLDAAWNDADATLQVPRSKPRTAMSWPSPNAAAPGLERHQRAGREVGEVFHPFRARVGCYVPGGTAPLVSTVDHDRGLRRRGRRAGNRRLHALRTRWHVNPGLLAALKLAGATEVYKIGGSQAIAALAFGTETIRPVTKIFGPGNSYVVEAKRQAFGVFPSICCLAPARCSFSPTSPAIPPSSPPTSSRRPSTARTAWPASSPMTPLARRRRRRG